jgi:molybdopterin molybdotransferase|tara:strand:- start:59011 stop:60192 length:1182 start_codon:yes stop_codon:yes gene_type:complete
MLSFEDAYDRLLSGIVPLAAEDVPLEAARGRILAAPLIAKLTQPPFAASAMDGYAIRWADMPGPWTVRGESAAGAGFAGSVEKGAAIRIFTGAPIPGGADTVIVQEDVERSGDTLTLKGGGPPDIGAHIRPEGNDYSNGQELLPVGSLVSAPVVGLAASAGHARLQVHAAPRVAIIATGDELVPPGTPPGPSQIVAGNGPMIAAALAAAGADVEDFGIVPDDRTQIRDALMRASKFDIVITIGGASVGDHDLVKDALDDAGATLDFWRIAIKPGKPLIAGTLGAARLVGLPGNPVSAYVCMLLFVRPMVLALRGADPTLGETNARLGQPLPANGDRRDHLRATLSGDVVAPLATQDSAQLAALARANSLIIRPPHAKPAATGESVPVLILDRT